MTPQQNILSCPDTTLTFSLGNLHFDGTVLFIQVVLFQKLPSRFTGD